MDAATPTSWPIAEQGLRYADLDIDIRPHADAYEMHIKLGFKSRVVYFDVAGRITHVRFASDAGPVAVPNG
jgi:hypothetical protein